MADNTTNDKAPGSYLSDIQNMKDKMKKVASGEMGEAVITGAVIGVIAGIGYSFFFKKNIIKYGVIGGLIGSVVSSVILTTKKNAK